MEKNYTIDMSESVMLRVLNKINYTFKKKHLVMPKQAQRSASNI